MLRTWDIFCSVVDNYGDVGVCWRLARQLANEMGQEVRLWVDNLQRLHQLFHAVDASRTAQHVAGVEVRYWNSADNTLFPQVHPADIVIEGFGVRLPASFVAAMAARTPPPFWINLEYLSAEPWVETHHGLPSPQAVLPLTKYFFFPGFTAATGGVLVERGLAAARDAFQADATAIDTFRRGLGIVELAMGDDRLWVSLFCYENSSLPALVEAWTAAPGPVTCVIPEGHAMEQIAGILGRRPAPGALTMHGALTIAPIPFLEQDDYDRLLWACDVNFVRGEDSFVRAQLAARPLLWQAYPQSDAAHLQKMQAFGALYGDGLEAETRTAMQSLFAAWNRQDEDVWRCWTGFLRQRSSLLAHAREWAARLAGGRGLAESLARFCENKL